MNFKNLLSKWANQFLAWLGRSSVPPAGRVPQKPASFHQQWMAHFNHTIRQMNKKGR